MNECVEQRKDEAGRRHEKNEAGRRHEKNETGPKQEKYTAKNQVKNKQRPSGLVEFNGNPL